MASVLRKRSSPEAISNSAPVFLLLAMALAVMGSYTVTSAAAACVTRDRRALLAFKAAVTKDPSRKLATWKASTPDCCSWEGVTCDASSGRVVQLDVSAQARMQGTLSPALGSLSELQVLNLQENSFHGSIPSSLGQLSKLQQLSLSNMIIESDSGSGGGLTGAIPESFGQLRSLQELDLSYNRLTGPLPSSIGGMASLQHIRIYNNQISGPIPASFGLLSNLFNADLALNRLSGVVPDAFTAKLTNLFFLYLDQNRITGLPKDMSNLKSLQIVYLNGNPLGSRGPSAISGLSTLPMLGELHLSSCGLSGPFPQWVANIKQLQDNSDEVTPLIDLSHNALTGPIPAKLGSVANLQSLVLSNNRLSGPIPASLANLDSLRFLQLQQNQLSGSIPASFGTKLQGLTSFNVSFNQLAGRIPQQQPFTTFPISSYRPGNAALCGAPLPACKPRRLS